MNQDIKEFLGDRIVNLAIARELVRRGFNAGTCKAIIGECISNRRFGELSSKHFNRLMSGDEVEVWAFNTEQAGNPDEIRAFAAAIVDSVLDSTAPDYLLAVRALATKHETSRKLKPAVRFELPRDRTVPAVLEFLQSRHLLFTFTEDRTGGLDHEPTYITTLTVSDGFVVARTSTNKKEGRAECCAAAYDHYLGEV